MPARGDRPDQWLGLTEKRELDDKGVVHAVVGGYDLDAAVNPSQVVAHPAVKP